MTGPDKRVLAGFRVIELASERIAFAGKLLADMGADVILVSRRAAIRPAPIRRSWTTSPDRSGASGGGITTPASAA